MRTRIGFVFPTWCGIALSLVVSVAPCLAQTPLGLDEPAHGFREGRQELPVLACDGEGYCAVAVSFGWPEDVVEETGIWHERWVRTVGPQGQVLAERQLHVNEGYQFWTAVVGNDHGFTFFWSRNYPRGAFFAEYDVVAFQRFDTLLRPLESAQELPPPDLGSPPRLSGPTTVVETDDGFAFLYIGDDLPSPVEGCASCERGLFLLLVDSTGALLRDPVSVVSDPLGMERPSGRGLARDSAGNLVVVFSERPQLHLEDDVFVRRFTPQGDPLGPEVRVNEHLPGDQESAAVAVSPEGGFLVAWQSELQDGDFEEIYARRYLPDGEPAGPEFRVNTVTRSAQRFPDVAADRHGNYAVTWMSFRDVEYWDIKLRLLRGDGTPINDEILVNVTPWTEVGGVLAFAPNDTLLVGYSHWTFDDDTLHDALYRRFAVAPGSEICRIHDGVWDCQFGDRRRDTLRAWFPFRSGETPLIGDADGDGRDDLCVLGGRTLRCDLDHAGRPAELEVRFGGRVGGVPFLADLDGDGRDELCLRRGGSVHCAAAGGGERMRFRGRTDLPALPTMAGDLDGDGRDELCAYLGGRFYCDALPLGGEADLVIPFGRRNDRPLLLDADGDGRDDPCVRRGREVLCDLERNGEAAWRATLGGRSEWILTGKLDGL